MKKFIIRNPFVSNQNDAIGRRLWDTSIKMSFAASVSNIDEEQKRRLLKYAGMLMNRSAKRYGFRNLKDMMRHIRKHPDKKIGPF